jgi:hypothetical protein
VRAKIIFDANLVSHVPAANAQALTCLRAFAFRGNPVSRALPRARLALIGAVPRMREVQCSLRFIDGEVTIDERVAGVIAGGGTEADAEKLRADRALWLRSPRGVPPGEVRSLDLECMTLRAVDLSGYTGLTALRLRGNALPGLEGLGLQRLTGLRVLDLRDNRLRLRDRAPREAALGVIAALPALVYLGLAGNDEPAGARDATLAAAAAARAAAGAAQAAAEAAAAAAGADPAAAAPSVPAVRLTPLVLEPPRPAGDKEYAKWRGRVLACLRAPLRDLRYPLRLLDGAEVSVSERVTAAYDEGETSSREAFRFDLSLHRALEDGRVPTADVVGLDMSDAGLAVASFGGGRFPRLSVLSLASNRLTGPALAAAGLPSCTALSTLDLRGNEVARLPELSSLLLSLPLLVKLGVRGNRGFDTAGGSGGGASARVRLLAGVPPCRRPEWRLRSLDGEPVTVDERVAATEGVVDKTWRVGRPELARIRLVLTLQVR